MESDIFKQKMRTNRNILGIAGAILGVSQWMLYNGDWNTLQPLIQFSLYAGIGTMLFAFLRMLYLFVTTKSIMSPVVNANLSQGATEAPMRLPFKIMLVIVCVLVVFVLLGFVVLNITTFL